MCGSPGERGAQAASLLFAAACRELPRLVAPQAPNPPIILIGPHHARIPRITRNVLKFLLQIALGPDQTIKRFRFPNRIAPVLDLINPIRREGFDTVRNFRKRKEYRFATAILALDRWLDEEMGVVGHHTGSV